MSLTVILPHGLVGSAFRPPALITPKTNCISRVAQVHFIIYGYCLQHSFPLNWTDYKKKKKSESHSDRRNFHCCTFSGPPPITNKCRQLTWHHYFSFQLHIVPIGITEKAFGGKKKKVQDSKITQDTLVFVTCNI